MSSLMVGGKTQDCPGGQCRSDDLAQEGYTRIYIKLRMISDAVAMPAPVRACCTILSLAKLPSLTDSRAPVTAPPMAAFFCTSPRYCEIPHALFVSRNKRVPSAYCLHQADFISFWQCLKCSEQACEVSAAYPVLFWTRLLQRVFDPGVYSSYRSCRPRM